MDFHNHENKSVCILTHGIINASPGKHQSHVNRVENHPPRGTQK